MTDYEKAVELWKNKNIQNDTDLSEALDPHLISYSYNSGKIENPNITYNDTREIFEHDGVSSYTGDLRTLFEIRNAKKANNFLIDSFSKRAPISKELIKEFQKLLTVNTYDERRYKSGERPGEFKKHDYVTGAQEVGALPEDVEDEIDELLLEIRDIDKKNALKAAAYFHVKFENIHPFADGNGRTGRLLMNYFLILHNHPPVTIFNEDRKQYYSALESWDNELQLEPMYVFLKEQTAKTWAKQIERENQRCK